MKQKKFNTLFVEVISKKTSVVSELLSQIKNGPRLDAKRALEVYQEDYQARLTEALKNTYRAIFAIIGDEDFNHLAGEYISLYPSVSSDLDDYGHLLDIFLKTHPLNLDYTFLSELAHFEWNFREVFHLEESRGLSPESLMHALQSENDLFELSQSARLLEYNFQITKLYALKESDSEEGRIDDYNFPQNILLYKCASVVKSKTLSKNQAAIVKRMVIPSPIQQCFQNVPATVTAEEIQGLFQILGTDRLISEIKKGS